jgi:hypothetical protein
MNGLDLLESEAREADVAVARNANALARLDRRVRAAELNLQAERARAHARRLATRGRSRV